MKFVSIKKGILEVRMPSNFDVFKRYLASL